MRVDKKLLVLAAVAVAGVSMLAVPAAASARSVNCTLKAVSDVKPDIPPMGQGQGQAGTYTMRGFASCVVDGFLFPQARVLSAGEYVNDDCLSGTAAATVEAATTIDMEDNGSLGGPWDIPSMTYVIHISNGEGILDVRSVADAVGVNDNETETVEPDGGLAITPLGPGLENCLTTRVDEFQVAGAFSVTWDPFA